MSVKYLEGNDTFQIGDMLKSDGTGYSVVGLQMKLTNLHSKYMWVYYLPTSMFTVTSWVSFLLPPTSYPSRTSLLVTVFLCQIGLFNAVIRDTPNQDGGNEESLRTSIISNRDDCSRKLVPGNDRPRLWSSSCLCRCSLRAFQEENISSMSQTLK